LTNPKILQELTNKRTAACHKQIAETYFDSTIEHSQKYNLILNHIIEYTTKTKDNDLLKEKFGHCYDRLEDNCDYYSLRTSLSKILEIKFSNNEDDKSFVKDIRYKYVKVLTASGATFKALEVIQKIEDRDKIFKSDPEMIRKLLPLKADCFRLTGRVEDCEKLYENALNDCTDATEKADLSSGYGHALYLCGKFLESKNIYDKIDVSLLSLLKRADFEYRRSKTFRMLGDFDNAMACADEALRICELSDNNECHEITIVKARSHWTKCACYRFTDDFGNALIEYEKAKTLLNPVQQKIIKCDENDVRIDVIGHRVEWFLEQEKAEIYRGKGEHLKAKSIFEFMQKQTNELGEKNREALSYLGIAESIRTLNQKSNKDYVCHDAISYYGKARDLFRGMNLEWGLLVCDMGMALANQDFKDETWKKFLTICDEYNFLFEKKIVSEVIKDKETKFYQINFI